MTAFLNGRPEQAAAGYWSWTDGSATPVRSTATDGSGSVESVTVKPAFFRTPGGVGNYTFPGGWLAPESLPQHQGSTLLMQMRPAMQDPRPQFVIVSQWNEFTSTVCSSPGQPPLAPHATFRSCADTYNATLTDDIEPTSLTECGDVKPGDSRCGGWGFSALNYLRAAIWAGLRQQPQPEQGSGLPCVLAVVTPDDEAKFAAGTKEIEITWRTLAPVAASPGQVVNFAVQVDGASAACDVKSKDGEISSCTMDTSHLQSGEHLLTVTAVGAWTKLGVSRDSFEPFSDDSSFTPNASVHVHFKSDDEACPCGDPGLCRPLKAAPSGRPEVYAFDPGTSQEVWQHLDWSSITTIAFAGPAPIELVCDAHRRGVRAVVLTGLMPEANATAVSSWISKMLAIAKGNGTDGVNIDIEGYGTVDAPEPPAALTEMVANLSQALRADNPLAQISMDAVGYPSNGYWWTGYDWAALAPHVDFFVVMMYDLLNVE